MDLILSTTNIAKKESSVFSIRNIYAYSVCKSQMLKLPKVNSSSPMHILEDAISAIKTPSIDRQKYWVPRFQM